MNAPLGLVDDLADRLSEAQQLADIRYWDSEDYRTALLEISTGTTDQWARRVAREALGQ